MNLLPVSVLIVGMILSNARAAEIFVQARGRTNAAVQVIGNNEDEWRFQRTTNFNGWSEAAELGTVFSNREFKSLPANGIDAGMQFFRAVRTDGLFDRQVFRRIDLSFGISNWATRLASGRMTGSNTICTVVLENGATNVEVGARYKGNTSYEMGGMKKSINLEFDFTNSASRLMGHKTVNLNNAAGDETIMREPIYFNVMNEYAPSPRGAQAKVYINGAYWGVYSFVEQENSVLVKEWFPSSDGDRWRTPNFGIWAALNWRGTNISSYRSFYDLRTDNSTNAWQRLVNAIDVLNNTPTNSLREKVEEVLAVDRWLWFLAVENVFADDDSYFNKGADYGFYYEPESGRIHPIEHDGNEAFVAMDVHLTPVQGVNQADRPVLYKFLRNPELRQRYLAHMRTVLRERYNPDYLTAEINRFHAQSIESIIIDPKKNFTMASYTNDLRALKTFVTNRHRYLTNHSELRPLPPIIHAVYGPKTPPNPTEETVITARVEAGDTNGIDSVWLYWRDKTYGRFTWSQMLDGGQRGNDHAGDGIYSGVTTNFPAGHKIHYYVEARAGNAAKAAAFAPARAEQETFSYRVALTTASNTPVVINEIMAANVGTIADPQGDYDDWIELRNVTSEEVDLSGHYLSDEPNNPRKWRFPDGTRIPADGYLLIWADENGLDSPGLHASFKLAAGGEEIFFADTDANFNAVLDRLTFGPQTDDVAFGRAAANSDRFEFMEATPGATNK